MSSLKRVNLDRIWRAYDPNTLRYICELGEDQFAEAFDLETFTVAQRAPEDFYLFRDNGSSVLAVAHLDTVGAHYSRGCHFVETEAGTVVFSRALDDRLGAYVILDLLPQLGVEYDLLLTVGEESGMSTAAFFDPPKQYDWMIEFDRGGTDVVMYQYDDQEVTDMVKRAGARVGNGIFSDICYLEHLGIKGFNWGVGYQDYHSDRAHAYLDDTFDMVDRYLTFHEQNEGTYMPHYPDDGDDVANWWRKQDAWCQDWSDDERKVEDVDLPDSQDWDGTHWAYQVT